MGLSILVLLLIGAAVLAVVLSHADAGVVGVVVSVATALVTPLITAIAVQLWRRRSWAELDLAAALAVAGDDLAEAVRRQWEPAVLERRLRGPIPVRWAWSTRPVTGRVDEAVGPGDGLGIDRLEPLPGTARLTAEAVQAGGLPELFAVYAGLSSGRTVVLGDPGSGKSAAAILILLEALQHRRRLDAGTRQQVPVPVLLTLHTWNPHRDSLRDWLARRISGDFRFLRDAKYGPDVAARLIRDNRIALFLDGFDEMVPQYRAAALEALDDQVDLRLMLFSRSEQYSEAVRGRHLRGAAALELRPVPAVEAARYLARWQVADPPPPWRRLIEQLETTPDGPLARALASPLTVTLVRDTFPEPAELDELLVPGRFSTPAEVEDHLLDRVLPAAYRQRPGQPPARYDLSYARRWLAHLATEMARRDVKELAWWRMHQWAPAWPRVVVTTLLGGAGAAVTAAVIAWLTEDFGERDTIDPGPAAVVGLLLGAAIGLAQERRESPVSGLTGFRGSRFSPAMGLVSALAAGIATVLTVGPMLGPSGLAVGVVAAVAAGTMTGFMARTGTQRGTEALPPQAGITGTLGAGLTRGLPAGFATGVPVGLATGVPAGLVFGTSAGLTTGLVIGLTFVLAFGLVDGFATVATRVAAPLDPASGWRQDRRRSLAVGGVFGATVGLAAGITDAMAMIRHDPFVVAAVVGLVTAVAVGGALAVAAALAVSTTWRTAVFFLQLRARGNGPVQGMAFLADAHRRGVLRVVGSAYQFRHARLQDRLARDAPGAGPNP
ncbi:hypothetical protein Daura_33210 [Dactylosporangium aurantiacum]|uniref:NACHT domain-containing protein n=1 Tax=Dactylosporangium aurantiacum TaxID=35754 RepID=A0A9Q9I8A6_9ACTN|nr:hypothetical protein [Dactylosporangium aurantiacum]MDG6105053.1 hypothetical protein [Dactylosporangium aurantiacum]UWZ51584.1 hypothetical protein Daura_33210 [Dactylosporangium aurantiacum]